LEAGGGEIPYATSPASGGNEMNVDGKRGTVCLQIQGTALGSVKRRL